MNNCRNNFKTKRICLVDGTWQLIMLHAALNAHGISDHSDTAIILRSRPQNSDLAKTLIDFANILFPTALPIPLGSEIPSDFSQIFSNNSNPRETWVSFFNDPIERILRCAYPHAEKFLFEDGFGLYALDEKTALKDRILLYTKKLFSDISLRENLRQIRQRFTSRTSIKHQTNFTAYLFLDKVLGKPNFTNAANTHPISCDFLTNALNRLRLHIDKDILLNGATDEKTALFVSQNFFDHGQMSFERELEIYNAAIEKLVKMGYRVVWKDHPKTSRRFGPSVSANFAAGAVEIYSFPSHLPVELVGSTMKGPVVGVTSTSLFYLRLLYGVMTFHICDELDEVFFGSKRGMQRAIKDKIPSYATIASV